MIFRLFSGECIEINKLDYLNDTLYYKKIMKIKSAFAKFKINNTNSTLNNTKNNYSTQLIKNIFGFEIEN
jgi:hypothetical protein